MIHIIFTIISIIVGILYLRSLKTNNLTLKVITSWIMFIDIVLSNCVSLFQNRNETISFTIFSLLICVLWAIISSLVTDEYIEHRKQAKLLSTQNQTYE